VHPKAGRGRHDPPLCCRVKFGAFYDHLQSSHEGGFDRVASGHYARLVREGEGAVSLALTPDAVKDQTYFLASLSQGQLSRAMFPLGSLTKVPLSSPPPSPSPSHPPHPPTGGV